MKKKIAILVLFILVMTFAFTGCNMVTLNKTVDDNIVVANVTYQNGLSDTVTKKELKEMFATQGQLYIYYYGWTPKQAYDFCVEALAQQKLTRLKALDELCKGTDLDPVFLQTSIVDHLSFEEGTKPSKKTIYDDILSVDEKISVIKNYNKQLNDAVDSLVKEIEKEELLNKEDVDEPEKEEDDKEEIKDKPAIREVRAKEDEKEPEVKLDSAYADDPAALEAKKNELKALKRFEQQWNIDRQKDKDEIKALETKVNNETDATKKAQLQKDLDEMKHELEKKEDAYSRLNRRLEKNGKTRNQIFEDIVNSTVVSHYKLVVISKDKDAIDSYVEAANLDKKNEIINSNKNSFFFKNQTSDGEVETFLSTKYEAAVKGESPVYYHPIVKEPVNSKPTGSQELGSAGYGYTFNILLNFNKNDAEILKQLKAKADQTGKASDKALVETKKNEFAAKITVNISNPNYDPEKKCASGIDKADLDKKDADGNYLYKDKYEYHKCDNPDCPLKPFGYDVKDTYNGVLTPEEVELVKVGYDVPVLVVLKMINFDLQKIVKDTTSYKTEYDRQVALREEFTKWMYKVNDDPGMFSKDNARGYLVPKTGESSYVESYTNQARTLMGGFVSNAKEATYANPTYAIGEKHFVGNYHREGLKDNPTDFTDFMPMMAISEFGIHIIMISEMPGYYQTADHILMDDAPFTYNRTSYTKVADSFKDQLRKYKEGKVYEKAVVNLIQDYDSFVKVDENAYKKLYEEK